MTGLKAAHLTWATLSVRRASSICRTSPYESIKCRSARTTKPIEGSRVLSQQAFPKGHSQLPIDRRRLVLVLELTIIIRFGVKPFLFSYSSLHQ